MTGEEWLDETAPRELDDRPARTAALLAVVAALVALAGTAMGGDASATALAAGGALGVGAGVVAGRRGLVAAGAGAAVLGALAAGVAGAGPGVTLSAAVAAVVAWDAGEYAIVAGAQVGRGQVDPGTESLHVGLTAAVGAVGAGGGYALFRLAGGGHPAVALVLLLVGALALAAALGS